MPNSSFSDSLKPFLTSSVYKYATNPYSVEFDLSMISSSSTNVCMAATGPNISSAKHSASSDTLLRTVGG